MVSTEVILTLASHASVPVGAVNDGVAGQLIVNGPPCPLNTGAVLSITLIVWLTGADTLPQSSVAVQVLTIE